MRKNRSFFKKSISMLLLIVFVGVIFSSFTVAQEGDHSIYNAFNAGLISLEIIGTGAASGHIADMIVTGAADGVSLDLAESGLEGKVLENPDINEQDEVVVDTPGTSTGPGDTTYTPTDNVVVNTGENVTIPIIGYCINYDLANPSDGTTFTLSGISSKTDITQLSSVLQTIFDYMDGTNTFDVDFDSQELFSIFQIAIWASQPENADVTLTEYAQRGYTLNTDQLDGIMDILDDSGIDYTNVVALSGKEKVAPGDPSESSTSEDDEIPWLYVAIGAVVVALGGTSVYAAKKRGSRPTSTTPTGTEEHVTSYSTPISDETSAKNCGKSCTTNCDLQCEGSCIALCERGIKGWDPNKKRGVPCSKACMGGCTMSCTKSCTADCTGWTQ
jgi:hypothetical protein